MTLNERRFYRIAVFLSIVIHLAILFIVIPVPDLAGQNNDLETMSPEMLDLLPGSTNSQPALVESAKNTPDRSSQKPEAQAVIPPQPERQQHSPPQVKPEVEVKVEKTKPEPVKPKEELKKEPVKPKEKLKKEPLKPREELKKEPIKPKEELKEKVGEKVVPTAKPPTDAKIDPNSKPVNVNVTKPGEVGKPPPTQDLGSGDKMVSGGTEVTLWTPKNVGNEEKEGTVKLRALITVDGEVERVDILELASDSRLNIAASRHIQQHWKFKAINEKYFVDLLVIFKSDKASIQFLSSKTRN
jgi:hypothetical protein